VSKQQVILQTEESNHQLFLLLKREITVRHTEYSPLFQMLSPCEARGPAGQLSLLALLFGSMYECFKS